MGRLRSKDGEILSASGHQGGACDVAALELKKDVQMAKNRARKEATICQNFTGMKWDRYTINDTTYH